MGVYHQLYNGWSDMGKPCIDSLEGQIDYGGLHSGVLAACTRLSSLGACPGDVVCLQLPKSRLMLELVLAGMAMGCPVLPLNDSYTPREVAYFVRDSGASLAVLARSAGMDGLPAKVVSADEFISLPSASLAGLPPEPPDTGLAVLLYTSGTTGEPKGAMISHGNILALVRGLHSAWRWSSRDRLLHALPLFHVHGLFVAQLAALHAGACSIWMDRFDPVEAVRLIGERKASVFMGVPTLYQRLLSLPEKQEWGLGSMRLFTSGSAPLPAAIHEAFTARTGHRILERYGMTEAGIVLSNPYEGLRKPGAVGFPVCGAEVGVFGPAGEPLPRGEVGEIRMRGPSVVRGYLGRPAQTAASFAGGWLRSGDLGSIDADGYFRIAGRAKDLVISGGMNVYPLEVEAVLREHPGVIDAAVIGVPDPGWGERVVALAVARPGLDNGELVSFTKERLAPYKRPKEIRLVEALPRNAMGKVQKERIRREWAPLQ